MRPAYAFFLLSFLRLALSACVLPPSPAGPFAFPTAAITQTTLADEKESFTCPDGYFPYGNMGSNGPLLLEAAVSGYMCDPADCLFRLINPDSGTATMLSTAICRVLPDPSAGEILCNFELNGVAYGADPGEDVTCPGPGGTTEILNPDPQEVTKLRCDPDANFYATFPNDANEALILSPVFSNDCVPPTPVCTTTSTSTTTTTTTTTTTPDPSCPPEGVWGEWMTTGVCAGNCGACSMAPKRRTCSTINGNCPCAGDTDDVGPCGLLLCTFPAKICCSPYIKTLRHYDNGTAGLICA